MSTWAAYIFNEELPHRMESTLETICRVPLSVFLDSYINIMYLIWMLLIE